MKKGILIALGLASVALVACTDNSTKLQIVANTEGTAGVVFNKLPGGVVTQADILAPSDNATSGTLTAIATGATVADHCHVDYADNSGVEAEMEFNDTGNTVTNSYVLGTFEGYANGVALVTCYNADYTTIVGGQSFKITYTPSVGSKSTYSVSGTSSSGTVIV